MIHLLLIAICGLAMVTIVLTGSLIYHAFDMAMDKPTANWPILLLFFATVGVIGPMLLLGLVYFGQIFGNHFQLLLNSIQ
jgi:hypothetical protein